LGITTSREIAVPNPDLLIRGGHVVTFDPHLGDLPAADVLIRDGRIAAVGTGLAADLPESHIIEASGRLVMPGLVDTHRHVWQGALGGSTGQVSLIGYSAAVIAGIAPLYEPADSYAGTLWGALQALDAGITTIADWAHNLPSPEHADANLLALQDAGIRGIFLYGGPGEHGPSSANLPRHTRRTRGACTSSTSRPGQADCSEWVSHSVDQLSPRPRRRRGTSSSLGNSSCRSLYTSAWRASLALSRRSRNSGCWDQTSTTPTRPS
jgi:hypothetical protein